MTETPAPDKPKGAIASGAAARVRQAAMTMQSLDPFGYWPALRSRVRGLGGKEKGDDRNYVFHTSYVPLPPGPAVAEVAFDTLAAETGMISVRVFQHLASGVPAVTEHGKITALLPSIAKTGRAIKLPFEVLPGAQYAVTGYVFGECAARARSLAVTIGPRAGEAADPARARSVFGRLRARRAASLTAPDAASLARPVSQGFSEDQTYEPDFARLTAGLPAGIPPAARWETAYIVRVLEQYGRLEPGARGLALSMADDPAAARVAAAGCDLTAIVLGPGETIADACARALPGDLARGFDFIWTRSDVFGAGGSPRALGLIEELIERLRPGGLGIHLVTTGGEMDGNALNRIGIGVAALGHVVGQLRPATAAAPVPFGFVVRRSTDDIIM